MLPPFYAILLGWLACLAAATASQASAPIKHVFVIVMENHDASQIYGNTDDAPFIQTLLRDYAHATNFRDKLPHLPSEPHYIWMEAGTNAFPREITFKRDHDPSPSNSTGSTAHLVTQIRNAPGVDWMTYQEDAPSGVCPIESDGRYAARHNPFVFFRDVSGDPPSPGNHYCIDHNKPYSALAADLAAGGKVASYVFITPNLCHDMHWAFGCSFTGKVRRGDNWLKAELPGLIRWAKAHAGVIFLTWDEGRSTGEGRLTSPIPFLAIGTGVKASYASSVLYDHGSIIKSVEELFGLPILPTVATTNDLSDLFEPGTFP